MNLLSLSRVSKTYDLKPVLQGVTLAIDAGERVGIIGANGAGKTTLFKIISGEIVPDEGAASVRRGATIGLLPQEPRLDPSATVHDTIAKSLVEVQKAAAQYREIADRMAACRDEEELRQLQPEHDRIEHRMEQIGGWQYQHRIDDILGRLKISDDQKLVGALSGGEKKRVALACALIQNPDLLVLDEPTNHLDAQTIDWLESRLDAYPGALALITHDRYFLDNVVDRMIEISAGSAASFRGGYSDYLIEKREREETEERIQARLLNMLRKEEEWLRRGVRARGTKSKYRVQNVLELRERTRKEAEENLQSRLSTTKRLGNTVLETSKLCKNYDGRALVKDLDFIMMKGDRVALLGPNGCGKTTLLRVLLGMEEPTSGTVARGKNTQIAYFAQDRLDMDHELTVWEFVCENAQSVKVGSEFRTIYSYMSDFKFDASSLHSRIKTLSGGEKNRLALAKLLLSDANLIVLDEPTNDLDIDTLQWIEEQLISFKGCILFVSHDRFFIDKVATSLLAFEEDGRVTRYAGNYSLYAMQSLQTGAERSESPQADAKKSIEPQKKSSARGGLTYKERLELSEAEKQLAELEEQTAELEKKLSDPASHGLGTDHKLIAAAAEQLEALKAETDKLYERWLELEEKR